MNVSELFNGTKTQQLSFHDLPRLSKQKDTPECFLHIRLPCLYLLSILWFFFHSHSHLFILYTDRREDIHYYNVAPAFLLKQMGANIDFLSTAPCLSGRITYALINCMRANYHLCSLLWIHSGLFYCSGHIKWPYNLKLLHGYLSTFGMNHSNAAFTHSDKS